MSVFLEHVLASMSDHLPLHAIVTRLMQSCGAERFGGLRSTLLSLFSACDYEHTIMGSANRLVTRDVFGVVRAGFRLRTGECVQVMVEAAGEEEGEEASMRVSVFYRLGGVWNAGGVDVEITGNRCDARICCIKPVWRRAFACACAGRGESLHLKSRGQ